jgi:large subunit ribosomal protein L11
VEKPIAKKIKLQLPAGRATPAPPVGTVLGPAGINLQEFCTKFNEASKDKMGDVIPVEIIVYEDRSFDFKLKTPPAAFLLKKAAGLEKASTKGANEVVAVLTQEQIREIAEIKKEDLNAYDIDSAMKIIIGTARNMGIAVKGINEEELARQEAEALEEQRRMEEREAELAKVEAELMEAKQAAPEVPVVEEEKEVEEQAETVEGNQ